MHYVHESFAKACQNKSCILSQEFSWKARLYQTSKGTNEQGKEKMLLINQAVCFKS